MQCEVSIKCSYIKVDLLNVAVIILRREDDLDEGGFSLNLFKNFIYMISA